MGPDRAEVRNAGDPKQVRDAGRRAKRRQQRFDDALREVMASPAGRLVFGEHEFGFVARAGVYRSVFHPSGSQTSYNAGRQDFGHEIVAELLRVDEAAYELMEREARAVAKRDAQETEAAHTAPASEERS